jgi:hypothetical protein
VGPCENGIFNSIRFCNRLWVSNEEKLTAVLDGGGVGGVNAHQRQDSLPKHQCFRGDFSLQIITEMV